MSFSIARQQPYPQILDHLEKTCKGKTLNLVFLPRRAKVLQHRRQVFGQEPDSLRVGPHQDPAGHGIRGSSGRRFEPEAADQTTRRPSRVGDLARREEDAAGRFSRKIFGRHPFRQRGETRLDLDELEIRLDLPRRHLEPLPGNVLLVRAASLHQQDVQDCQ